MATTISLHLHFLEEEIRNLNDLNPILTLLHYNPKVFAIEFKNIKTYGETMCNLINDLCDNFNHFIGKISEKTLREGKHKEPEGIFASVLNAFDIAAPLKFEKDKAFMAHNIKATIYNICTVTAIMGIAAAILNPLAGIIVFAFGLAGRKFVELAMERTYWGSIGNQQQATDDSLHSWFFKSHLPSQTN
ncbi:MAG: hypothetical protein H0U49_03100 [Parachlamydiaceae bacterium]|nr:hypothetical protein [Parachlamydiaceae bacterium]